MPPSEIDADKQQLLPDPRDPFLSTAPRSGELSLFAQKLVAEAFVWLCSIIVVGSTVDFSSRSKIGCTSLCGFGIATGVVSVLISSIILFGQYLAFTNRVDKGGWFSSVAEKKSMMFLTVWWAIGVATLSAVEPHPQLRRTPVLHTTHVGILFGWLAFFVSIFGAYKAHHAGKEEQHSLHFAQVMSIQAAEDDEYANFS